MFQREFSGRFFSEIRCNIKPMRKKKLQLCRRTCFDNPLVGIGEKNICTNFLFVTLLVNLM